jgi:hypothetical protein
MVGVISYWRITLSGMPYRSAKSLLGEPGAKDRH